MVYWSYQSISCGFGTINRQTVHLYGICWGNRRWFPGPTDKERDGPTPRLALKLKSSRPVTLTGICSRISRISARPKELVRVLLFFYGLCRVLSGCNRALLDFRWPHRLIFMFALSWYESANDRSLHPAERWRSFCPFEFVQKREKVTIIGVAGVGSDTHPTRYHRPLYVCLFLFFISVPLSLSLSLSFIFFRAIKT